MNEEPINITLTINGIECPIVDDKDVNFEVKYLTKDELQADLDHFKKTEKTRELNSFEKGIKEEIENILNQINS